MKFTLTTLFTLLIALTLSAQNSGVTLGSSSANGANSLAAGDSSIATGIASIALGKKAMASGDHSISFGLGSSSVGLNSIAGGQSSSAQAENSIAMGVNNITHASAVGSVAMGGANQTYGDASFAIGQENIVHSFGSVAMGQYSEIYAAGTPTFSKVSTDRLFVLGNGENSSNRHNAITVQKNGNAGFNISNPKENLHVKGGVRVEKNAPTVPSPKTLYADALPLAYGSVSHTGSVVGEYGVQSTSRVSAGHYEIVLDNGWVGAPAVQAMVRFGGTIGQFLNVTHDFNTATKTITIFIADGSTPAGSDNAFSFIVYGQHAASTGSGCNAVTSPTGSADAPNDLLKWDVATDDCCVTSIPFAAGAGAIQVDVKDFVGGDPLQVNVDLSVISPGGGGASSVSTVVVHNVPQEVTVGTYTATNGYAYEVKVHLSYKYFPAPTTSDIVEATVTLTAL